MGSSLQPRTATSIFGSHRQEHRDDGSPGIKRCSRTFHPSRTRWIQTRELHPGRDPDPAGGQQLLGTILCDRIAPMQPSETDFPRYANGKNGRERDEKAGDGGLTDAKL
ncbi:Ankyrin repeat domain protein [Anopheles sinensis]|uniref:Ankyrin repeat domain protein n=1 Tax=Anopheles sinensis TaxID=74873 RepID=A0A084VTK5_ANOSI|nr:Ankyrin repeat domain protein [Anopheles sinensis]